MLLLHGDDGKVVFIGSSESVGALVGLLSEGSTVNCLLVGKSKLIRDVDPSQR